MRWTKAMPSAKRLNLKLRVMTPASRFHPGRRVRASAICSSDSLGRMAEARTVGTLEANGDSKPIVFSVSVREFCIMAAILKDARQAALFPDSLTKLPALPTLDVQ